MKLLHNVLGILCGFALMIILLITSIEAVTYWTPGYYEKEYAKYGVLNDVHMEMDDLLDVTDEMMAYLRGSREDLHVPTIVDGQPREFFNDREIAHMEDVRGLFLGGTCPAPDQPWTDRGLCDPASASESRYPTRAAEDDLHRIRFVFCGAGSAGGHYFHGFQSIFYHVPSYLL